MKIEYNPRLKLSDHYSRDVVIEFQFMASLLLSDMESNRLVAVLRNQKEFTNAHGKIRIVESRNPRWYSKLVRDLSKYQPHIIKRMKRTYKAKTNGGIRPHIYKALVAISQGKDMAEHQGGRYRYHTRLRLICFTNLINGFHMTIEGFPNHPDGEFPPSDIIRRVFIHD